MDAEKKEKRSGQERPKAPAFPGLLEEMTIEEVQAFGAKVAVLPLGSTEPHGPHLPYGTDTFEATRLARIGVALANERGAGAILYPALPITNNVNLRKFPFACRIGIRTLMNVIIDIVTQCKEEGVMKFVIVNGHGGNHSAINAAMREIAGMDNMPFVCAAARLAQDPLSGEHAGESETSRMLWIRPDLVRTHKLGVFSIGKLRMSELAFADFVRPWHLENPASAGGDTRNSTAEKGKAVIEAEAEGLAKLLVALSKATLDARFPYV